MKDNSYYLLIISLFVVIMGYNYWNENRTINEPDLTIYCNEYLKTYNELVDNAFEGRYKEYFPFVSDFYDVTLIKSNSFGSSIIIYKSQKNSIKYYVFNNRIEESLFEDINLNISADAFDPTSGTLLNFGIPETEYQLVLNGNKAFAKLGIIIDNDMKNTTLFKVKGKFNIFYDVRVITNQGDFLELDDTGHVTLINTIVDDIKFETAIIQGNNIKQYWSKKVAYEDAHNRFDKFDLFYAFEENVEIREFYAYEELENLILDIIKKKLNDPEYLDIDYLNDLEKLQKIAEDRYGVRSGFLDDKINYLQDKRVIEKQFFILTYKKDRTFTIYSVSLLFIVSLFSNWLEDKYHKGISKIFGSGILMGAFGGVIHYKPYTYSWESLVLVLIIGLSPILWSFYKTDISGFQK